MKISTWKDSTGTFVSAITSIGTYYPVGPLGSYRLSASMASAGQTAKLEVVTLTGENKGFLGISVNGTASSFAISTPGNVAILNSDIGIKVSAISGTVTLLMDDGRGVVIKNGYAEASLVEILSATEIPTGIRARPLDVAGCTLEMGADGKWVGTLGSLPKATADALYASGALVNLATGATYRDMSGTQYTYSAGAGWVGVSNVSGNILTNQSAASLGAEKLSATWGLGTGWSGTFATGFTHTTGNTATLTEATTYTSGGLYTVAWTVTGRTAGAFTVAVGGITQTSITATGSMGPKFTATTAIVVTPTTDFNGTVVLSVKPIVAQPATSTWLDAAGNAALEIRSVDASRQALAIGQSAGQSNTTGSSWTALGRSAGQSNTTGSLWTAIGQSAGQSNTTGSTWTAIGQSAGQSNTTGSSWTAIGKSAGQSNTTGSTWTAIGNSAGQSNTTGSLWTAIGQSAGRYQLGSNWVAIDGYGDRGSAANELANTPIIGTLASTAAAQTLSLNAVTTVYSVNEQNTTLSTSQTLAANCTGNQVIGASSLSIALPTAPFAGEEITFLQHGYAFVLTAASAIIYYGSATAVASASIPAANAITRAIYDGSAWNVR